MNELYFGAYLFGLGGLVAFARNLPMRMGESGWACVWCLVLGLAILLASVSGCSREEIALALFISIFCAIGAKCLMPRTTWFGVCLLMCNFNLVACGTMCVIDALDMMAMPAATKLIVYVLVLLMATVAMLDQLWGGVFDFSESSMAFDRRNQALRFARIRSHPQRDRLKVSVHVPCYNEPPEVVINTLNALSRLDYENFEVIVVDNNTPDPQRWQPLEERCAELGKRFRFFHVAPLEGAKAGGLNFALSQTSEDARLIALVDADYEVNSDFITRFYSLFDDPQVAFVQDSHDFRGWEDNLFLRAVYFSAYGPNNKILYPAANEYMAANLVGTMCVIRRSMLEEVGGWAQWCLSEDDELTLRLYAKGYVGHVFADSSGFGLIPETFENVQKQLFRWFAGPIQEFRVLWRLHLGFDRHSCLTLGQRMLRIKRALGYLKRGFFFIPSLALLLVSIFCMTRDAVVPVPNMLLLYIVVRSIVSHLRTSIQIRRLRGRQFTDHVLARLLENSMRWTYAKAFFVPVFQTKIAWVRTEKSAQTVHFFRAFASSRTETLLALMCFLTAIILWSRADFVVFDFVALTSLWMLAQGVLFLSTLATALLSEAALVRKA